MDLTLDMGGHHGYEYAGGSNAFASFDDDNGPPLAALTCNQSIHVGADGGVLGGSVDQLDGSI